MSDSERHLDNGRDALIQQPALHALGVPRAERVPFSAGMIVQRTFMISVESRLIELANYFIDLGLEPSELPRLVEFIDLFAGPHETEQ